MAQRRTSARSSSTSHSSTAHGDDLLREHVERVARIAHLLDEAFAHAAHDDGRLEQIAAPLREDLAGARLADVVTGPPDALHAARDGAGRLDEHDEIDGAHVDTELEAARGDDGAQVTGLELRLDLQPLFPRPTATRDVTRTSSSPARLVQAAASRSASRRALQNTIVVRCARISSSRRGCTWGQMLRGLGARRGRARRSSRRHRWRRARSCRRPGRSPRRRAPCASRRRRW